MNRRSGRVSDEVLIARIREKYVYDAKADAVRNRSNGQIVSGFFDRKGYMNSYVWIRGTGIRMYVKMHHIVWVLHHGRFPQMIDHINGDGRDNRIGNLREVGYDENDRNRIFAWKPNPSTGLPGVHKSTRKYQIYVGGKDYFFVDKAEAFHCLTLFGRMFKSEN